MWIDPKLIFLTEFWCVSITFEKYQIRLNINFEISFSLMRVAFNQLHRPYFKLNDYVLSIELK